MTVRRIAHRGFAGEYPENTLTAARRAAPDADVIEFDLRRCGSGELVCIHDETVDRVTDASGEVTSFSAAALSELSVLESDEGVPTLASMLDAIPESVGVNAELKETGIALDALETLRGYPQEVIVSSFHPEALSAARSEREGPEEAALAYLHAAAGGIEDALELGCDVVHPHHDLCEPRFVETAHEAGLGVNAWTATNRAVTRRLVDAGVDGVIADYPGVFEGD